MHTKLNFNLVYDGQPHTVHVGITFMQFEMRCSSSNTLIKVACKVFLG